MHRDVQCITVYNRKIRNNLYHKRLNKLHYAKVVYLNIIQLLKWCLQGVYNGMGNSYTKISSARNRK